MKQNSLQAELDRRLKDNSWGIEIAGKVTSRRKARLVKRTGAVSACLIIIFFAVFFISGSFYNLPAPGVEYSGVISAQVNGVYDSVFANETKKIAGTIKKTAVKNAAVKNEQVLNDSDIDDIIDTALVERL